MGIGPVVIYRTPHGEGMQRRILTLGTVAAVFLLVGMGTAAANPSPNGPGQPGAPNTTCGQFTDTPGHALGANSVFNGSSVSSAHYAGNNGSASLNHSASNHSVSQYDIACFQQTVH